MKDSTAAKLSMDYSKLQEKYENLSIRTAKLEALARKARTILNIFIRHAQELHFPVDTSMAEEVVAGIDEVLK